MSKEITEAEKHFEELLNSRDDAELSKAYYEYKECLCTALDSFMKVSNDLHIKLRALYSSNSDNSLQS
jgi:hypothetical protein